jgi:hypothetical protein
MSYFSRQNRQARRTKMANAIAKASGTFTPSRPGKLTTQNIGHRAIDFVSSYLSEYAMPSPQYSYSGTRKARLDNGTEIVDGVITITASFRSPSGVGVSFDIPVEIRGSEMIDPSVIIVGGAPRVIAQSTFDSLLKSATMRTTRQLREMYGAPPEHAEPLSKVDSKDSYPKNRQNMFSFNAHRDSIASAIRLGEYRGASGPELEPEPGISESEIAAALEANQCSICGFVQIPEDRARDSKGCVGGKAHTWPDAPKMAALDSMSVNAAKDPVDRSKLYADPHRNSGDDDHLDPAERERCQIAPGHKAHTAAALEVKDRGGATHKFASNAPVTIVRDLAGDGKQFVVRFKSNLVAVVDACDLRL